MRITLKWNDSHGVTSLSKSPDFDKFNAVSRSDFLKDALHDLELLYIQAVEDMSKKTTG